MALCWAIKPLEKVLLARGCLLSHHCGVSLGSSVLVVLAVSVPAVVAEFRWWHTWGDLVTLVAFEGGFVLPCQRWGQPGARAWHTDVAKSCLKIFRSV